MDDFQAGVARGLDDAARTAFNLSVFARDALAKEALLNCALKLKERSRECMAYVKPTAYSGQGMIEK